MNDTYSKRELIALGFSSVGNNVSVSNDVRFFAIEGSLGDNVRIDAYAILTGKLELHANVHVSPFCFLSATGGSITMQENSGIGSHVAVLTKSDDYTTDSTSSGKVSGDIVIGTNSIIGAGCKILPGSKVGNDCSVGSNAVINGNIKAGDMVISRGTSLITVGNRLEK
jgi:acetyltransferase-like isoleucine patch superfamily enzyme